MAKLQTHQLFGSLSLVLLCLLLGVACATAESSNGAEPDDADAGVEAAQSVPHPGAEAGVRADADAGSALPLEPFDVWRRREPIYELYVRHFSPAGNFKGVEAKLPELKALGIGIVWLLPVNEIGSIVAANGGQAIDAPHGNPYAVKSYERVNPEYGSDGTEASAEADLKSLVASAHALGMHVILDWVPNHTAWDNPLTVTASRLVRARERRRDQAGERRVSVDRAARLVEARAPRVHDDADGVVDAEASTSTASASTSPIRCRSRSSSSCRVRLEKVKPVFLLAEAGAVGFHPAFDMTYDWNVYPLLGDVGWGASRSARSTTRCSTRSSCRTRACPTRSSCA